MEAFHIVDRFFLCYSCHMQNVAVISENRFGEGIKDGIPIALGYLSVSFAFGIFAVSQGLASWQAIIISLTNLTSAGQLAGVPIIVGMLPFIELALTQLVINLRYALMSISLSQKLDENFTLFRRLSFSFAITDEIFAVASGKGKNIGSKYACGLSLTPIIGWTLGTTLGALAGNILPEIVSNALGIAIYGMFIAIIIPVARKSRAVLGVVLSSCAMSILFSYAPVLNRVSSGFVIIICGVSVSALFAWLCPVKEETAETDTSAEEGVHD